MAQLRYILFIVLHHNVSLVGIILISHSLSVFTL